MELYQQNLKLRGGYRSFSLWAINFVFVNKLFRPLLHADMDDDDGSSSNSVDVRMGLVIWITV